MKGDNNMKKNVKSTIGNLAINLGKHAVGKCMIPGMFDLVLCQEKVQIKYNQFSLFM